MNDRFEPNNIEEVDEALKYFNDFHDGYVEGFEVKFENYKSIDENGIGDGIGPADMRIILIVNAFPYGKEHNQLVKVEFIDVKSYEIISERHERFPMWGISEAITSSAPEPYEDYIFWDFYFLSDEATFNVICSRIVFTNIGYVMNEEKSRKFCRKVLKYALENSFKQETSFGNSN